MTKIQYLDRIDKLMDTVPRDCIELLKLEFDIINKLYECTKEEK